MITVLFAIVLFIFLYPYVFFPVFVVFFARVIGKHQFVSYMNDEDLPKVSLIISAYNEDLVIREKIINSLSLDYPPSRLEIIVASDGSSDQTQSIVESFEDARVRLWHTETRGGKNHCLNEVMGLAAGEIVVFTDANAMFDRQAVKALVGGFHSDRVGCVVGKECRISKGRSGTAKSDGLYWNFENLIKRAQNRLGLVLVGNGPIFAIRRHLFKPLQNDIANDFQTPMQIGNDGWGVVFQEDAISYENSASSAFDEYQRKVRIVTRGLVGFKRHVREMVGLRLFVFVSHKLMRWFALYLQIILFALSLLLLRQQVEVAIAALAVQAAIYLSAIVGFLNPWNVRRTKIIAVPFYFCLVNAAAAVAILKYAGGGRVSTWEKAVSVRS
ncbi:glycosyl transferase [Burkholderia sp. Ch1-1]|nr:glycosyl transferase [Burkholderia sp. Ch1-1]